MCLEKGVGYIERGEMFPVGGVDQDQKRMTEGFVEIPVCSPRYPTRNAAGDMLDVFATMGTAVLNLTFPLSSDAVYFSL